jgi:hypothetical protein
MEFDNAKIIVQKRKNGLQPAIFIIDEENTVHMVTITPDRNFDITNEGHIGERYDENGNWVGYSKTTINFDNTFFVTPNNIDEAMIVLSNIISDGINMALDE